MGLTVGLQVFQRVMHRCAVRFQEIVRLKARLQSQPLLQAGLAEDQAKLSWYNGAR